MKKSLVILGANGYIGHNLIVRAVRDRNIRIKALVYKENNLRGFNSDTVRVYKGDIGSRSSLRKILKKGDTVVNLVGVTTASSNAEEHFRLNAFAQLILLEECVRSEVKKIIFISTLNVYRPSKIKAVENDPVYPQDFYSLSKVLGENIYSYFHRVHKLPTIILRLGSVFGPYQKKGILHAFANSIKNDGLLKIPAGSVYRDFIFVDDAVDGILKAAAFKTDSLEYFNLCGSRRIGLYSLAQKIKKMIHLPFLIIRKGKPPLLSSTFAANSRAARLLNFRQQTPFDKGLRETLFSYGLLNIGSKKLKDERSKN